MERALRTVRLAVLLGALASLAAWPAAADMHAGVIDEDACTDCHVDEDSEQIDRSNCLACHGAIESALERGSGWHYTSVVTKGQDCGACHREHEDPGENLVQWRDAAGMVAFGRTLHADTGFPLTADHAGLDCRGCHDRGTADYEGQREDASRSFLGLTAGCTTCHEAPHGTLFAPGDCADCHLPTDLHVERPDLAFRHAEATGFALRGEHTNNHCRDCHAELVFSKVGVVCADCHDDVVHRGELGFDCARCHDESGWRGSAHLDIVANHAQTRFPLLGRHALMDCGACHVNMQDDEYSGLGTDCIDCHAADYGGSEGVDHAALGFSVDCQQCHSPSHFAWSEVVFEHSASFPLTQGHAGVDCASCHYGSAPPDPQDCFACHRVSNPPHDAAGFPSDCAVCHSPTSFEGVDSYSHAASGFPGGVGAHIGLSCTTCHFSGTYAGFQAECYTCHSGAYNEVFGPTHPYPPDCELCHQPTSWDDTRQTNWEVTR